jgi:hypothetical protein
LGRNDTRYFRAAPGAAGAWPGSARPGNSIATPEQALAELARPVGTGAGRLSWPP